MNKVLIGIPLLLLSASVLAQTNTGQGKVTYVIDGDTYCITADTSQSFRAVTAPANGDKNAFCRNNNEFKTRILNIDTPESVHYNDGRNTAAGTKVSEIVKAELTGKRVNYECTGVGYYKRPLCTVYLADNGQDYGLNLVQRGLSPYVIKYGRHLTNNDGYSRAELDAKRNRLGMHR